MKKSLIAMLFLVAAMGAFGASFSQNVDFGGYHYSILHSDSTAHEMMAAVTYRYIYYPNDIGFYYGADITVAFPTYTVVYNNGYSTGLTSKYSNAFIMMMPFGYRWSGEGKESAFYLGGGPSVQFLSGFDIQGIVGVGITSEFGFETNMTEGSQFHFAFQFGYNPGVWGTTYGYAGYGFNSALRFGITWRRIKPTS